MAQNTKAPATGQDTGASDHNRDSLEASEQIEALLRRREGLL